MANRRALTDDEERPDLDLLGKNDVFSDSDVNSKRGRRWGGPPEGRGLYKTSGTTNTRSQHSMASTPYASNPHIPTTLDPALRESDIEIEDEDTSDNMRVASDEGQRTPPPPMGQQQTQLPGRYVREGNRRCFSPMTIPIPERHFMEDHNSFHGAITGEEASRRLSKSDADTTYLTRFSSINRAYVLTILKKELGGETNLGNFRLVVDQSSRWKHSVFGMERRFESIDALLGHYENNRIHPEFDSIGRRLTVQRYNYFANKKSCVIL